MLDAASSACPSIPHRSVSGSHGRDQAWSGRVRGRYMPARTAAGRQREIHWRLGVGRTTHLLTRRSAKSPSDRQDRSVTPLTPAALSPSPPHPLAGSEAATMSMRQICSAYSAGARSHVPLPARLVSKESTGGHVDPADAHFVGSSVLGTMSAQARRRLAAATALSDGDGALSSSGSSELQRRGSCHQLQWSRLPPTCPASRARSSACIRRPAAQAR